MLISVYYRYNSALIELLYYTNKYISQQREIVCLVF